MTFNDLKLSAPLLKAVSEAPADHCIYIFSFSQHDSRTAHRTANGTELFYLIGISQPFHSCNVRLLVTSSGILTNTG